MKKHELAWVQALRGVAALMVVLCHSRINFIGTPLRDPTEIWMRPGAMGVDLFFLISGFIMVYTTRNLAGTGHDGAIFLIKRFARIWPVYAAIVLIDVGLAHFIKHMQLDGANITKGLLVLLPSDPGQLDWANIAKSLIFLPCDPRKPPYFGLPYAIGWTLNFEAYFYLVFGLSMLAKRYRWAVFFGWMACSLVALPWFVAHSVSLSPKHDYNIGIGYVDQMVNPVIWDFVAGVLVGLLFTSTMRLPFRPASVAGILLSIGAAFWWAMPGNADFHGISGWGGPLALMFAFMALAFKEKAPTVPYPLLWLGEISYSLYLTHLLAFDAMTLFVASRHPEWKATWIYTAAVIALGLVFATISNKLLEKGLSELVRKGALRLLNRPLDLPIRADSRQSAP